MDTHKEYLSKEKHEELRKELDFLMHDRRKEIAEALEEAKSLGDLSENAEYHSAREAQADIEARITELEDVLKNATIVSSKHKTDAIVVGASVDVSVSGTTRTYKIVGSEEADVAAGKISNKSPLGDALMGKKKGEDFSYNTPKGMTKGKVLDIR